MDDAFIDALEHLDRVGHVPGRADVPATFALLERAKREHAVSWDEERNRYVLTGTGRQKVLSRRGRDAVGQREAPSAEIRQFRRRAESAAG